MILNELDIADYGPRFESKTYGDGVDCVAIVLLCRGTLIDFPPTCSLEVVKEGFSAQRTFFMDVFVDLEVMRSFPRLDRASRLRVIADRLIKEVPKILAEHPIEGFNNAEFSKDFCEWVADLGWLDGGAKTGM